MANIGSLIVDLALESANFINGLRNAQNQSNTTAQGISKAFGVMKGAAAGFIGVLSVDLFAQKAKEAFDYADAIVDLADRTGMATGALQEFRYAAQMSGSSVESADAAVDKFAKNLGAAQNGNEKMAKTLKDLNVTSKDTTTAFRQAVDGISKLDTATARNQKTQELFGKSAGDLIVLMGEGTEGFDALAEAARSYGIVLDDGVLRNAGKVNDQLDTMKMILDAQFANMIIQNADALMTFANAAITAGSAAVNFFEQMRVNRLWSTQTGFVGDRDVPHTVWAKVVQGKSGQQMEDDDRAELKTFSAGRRKIFDENLKRYNGLKAKGVPLDDMRMQALRAENAQLWEAERKSKQGFVPPKPLTSGTLPTGGSGGGKKRSGGGSSHELSAEELDRNWQMELLRANNDVNSARRDLTTDPTLRGDLEAFIRADQTKLRAHQIDGDSGTDKEVLEGKKRYTVAQAKVLKLLEEDVMNLELQKLENEELADIASRKLELVEAGLQNDSDVLSSQQNLARSTVERRDLAMKLVRNQFEQERLQLEHTVELAKLGQATKEEREAAEARLKLLPKLKTLAEAGVNKSNQTPLEAYLDQIPKTSAEINEAMEAVQVDGLNSLQDGLLQVMKGTESVGEAFTNMANTIIDGLMKIALQKAIIEPLGALLFGGGGESGGGGLFGSIVKGITGAVVKGGKANGGMTSPGIYEVGERGRELVGIGAGAHVLSNAQLRAAANDNRGDKGVTVHIASIVSNDPEAIRRAAMEGIAQAMPMISQQASDKTLSRLQRRGL